MVWLPLHPALKNLPGSWDVAQHLLHVDVFVPQLINSGQDLDCPVPDVAGMIDEAMPHLHLGIFKPDGGICVSYFQRPLPDWPGPSEILLPLFPLCILQQPWSGLHRLGANWCTDEEAEMSLQPRSKLWMLLCFGGTTSTYKQPILATKVSRMVWEGQVEEWQKLPSPRRSDSIWHDAPSPHIPCAFLICTLRALLDQWFSGLGVWSPAPAGPETPARFAPQWSVTTSS